jgi:hypothetical protein
MKCEVSGITRQSFHDVVSMVHKTLGAANPLGYTRAAAERFVVDTYDSTFVLYRGDMVLGAYAFLELPNVYSLNFFALHENVRKSKCGYLLYKDMKQRLSGRPVNVTIYGNNDSMINVVKKRGVFVGRVPSVGNTTLTFYSIMFDDFKKKDKR